MEADKDYVVAGWASIIEGTQGPPIWDVVAAHLRGRKVVSAQAARSVRFVRAGN
jgi:sulfur-oxidizing protein SoxB